MHHPGPPVLAVQQGDAILVQTDLVPLQRHDLPPPTAGEKQQAYRRHREPVLFLVQNRQEAGKLVLAQVAFPLGRLLELFMAGLLITQVLPPSRTVQQRIIGLFPFIPARNGQRPLATPRAFVFSSYL
jgi:hypothetical protein